jgi:hypothetical protein
MVGGLSRGCGRSRRDSWWTKQESRNRMLSEFR